MTPSSSTSHCLTPIYERPQRRESNMKSSHKLHVGAVSYLNTKPLIFGLDQHRSDVELILDYPSRLADQLATGALDVALIPSIEYFRGQNYSIVSDACIACRGPVLSVKLYGRRPASEIRTLALDEGSRTSVALSRILLKERFGIEPELVHLPVEATIGDTAADAVLLIGDRAIQSPPGQYNFVWDLGDQWCRWAELPFVFAMWTARPDADVDRLETALGEARDAGLAHLNEIAAAEAPKLGLTEPQCISYLRDNLYFYLGPREQRGLQLFYDHAVKLGLAPAGVDVGRKHFQTSGQSG
jgi:chorismate dehydratase